MRISQRSLWLILAALLSCVSFASLAQPRPAAPPDAPSVDSTGVPELDRLRVEFVELQRRGDTQGALRVGRRALRLAEQRLGKDHEVVGTWLNNMAAIHFAERRYAEARKLVERDLEITKKRLGPKHQKHGLNLLNLAKLLMAEEDPKAAVPLLEESAQVIEQALGAAAPLLSTVLHALGDAHVATRAPAEAKPAYERALAIRAAAFGQDHLLVAEIHHALGGLERAHGDHATARRHFEEALRIEQLQLGTTDWRLSYTLASLALVEEALGRYHRAEELLRRALALKEKHLGADHVETATVAANLGSVLLSTGSFGEAERLIEQALRVLERQTPVDVLGLTKVQMNLAMVHRYRGDFARAARILQQVVATQESSLGPEHVALAMTLTNLAEMELARRDEAAAVPLLERALAIRVKALGPDHPAVANTLHNLAAALSYAGQTRRALEMNQRVVATWSRALGSHHPRVATALNNQALLEQDLGHYEAARELLGRALGILDERKLRTVPARAQFLENLALLHARTAQVKQALTSLRQANDVRERMVATLITAGSEQQKLALVTEQAINPSYAVGIHLHAAAQNTAAAELALTTVLRRKGQVLDAMSRSQQVLRQRLAKEDQALLDSLFETRSQLANAVFGAELADGSRVAELEKRAEQLERAMSARSAEFSLERRPVTIAEVQAALDPNSVLVELIRYAIPTELAAEASPPASRARYAAYVLGSSGAPRWIALGEAEAIDREVHRVREAMADRTRWEIKRLARELDKRLMEPIRPLLGKTTRVYLAPDGLLNLLPFEALVDEEDRYLVERYSFSYLTSGRDLVRLQLQHPSRSPATVLANPTFGEAEASPAREAATNGPANESVRAQRRMRFTPLPETALEASTIGEVIPDARVLTGKQADKKALRSIHGPRILHLATHGFFLGAASSATAAQGTVRGMELTSAEPGAKPRRPAAHPLLLSGLALTGANQPATGEHPGVLTALEASGLDLRGTRLVVMSACDTGLGEVRGGEGVFGLRRALVMAGAETQVMSLWKVDDEATRRLMEGYYRNLTAGQGRRDALRKEQLAMLSDKQTSHPHYWAAFIVSGARGPLDRASARPPSVEPSARGCACRLGLPRRGTHTSWLLLVALGLICASAFRRRNRGSKRSGTASARFERRRAR